MLICWINIINNHSLCLNWNVQQKDKLRLSVRKLCQRFETLLIGFSFLQLLSVPLFVPFLSLPLFFSNLMPLFSISCKANSVSPHFPSSPLLFSLQPPSCPSLPSFFLESASVTKMLLFPSLLWLGSVLTFCYHLLLILLLPDSPLFTPLVLGLVQAYWNWLYSTLRLFPALCVKCIIPANPSFFVFWYFITIPSKEVQTSLILWYLLLFFVPSRRQLLL